jgi:predicted membrane protein
MLKILSVIAFFAGLLFLIYIGVLLSRLGKWVGWEIAHWREAK